MDIDDEFAEFMRRVHPDLQEHDPQWSITRNAFFGGMMAMFGVLNAGGSAKRQVRTLMDVRGRLARHARRAVAGMEPGFTNADFRG